SKRDWSSDVCSSDLSFSGCLPMLIQMPILIAFYHAIRRTPEIAAHNFLWVNLGQTDIIVALIAITVYFIQSRVSLIGLDEAQRKQVTVMGVVADVMIGLMSFNVSASVPLYWAVGGLFMIFQTLISKKIYLSHKKEQEAESVKA